MTAKRQPVTFPVRKPLQLEEAAAPSPAPAAEPPAAAPTPAASAEVIEDPKPGVAPSRVGKKAVTFYLDRDKWLALRTASLRTGRPTHELMAEATEWLLQQYPAT